MRLTLNRLTHEVRQAIDVSTSSPPSYRLQYLWWRHPDARHLRRQRDDLDAQVNGGTATPVQDQLASTDLFAYENAPPMPGAQWVKIELRVHPKRSPDTMLVLDSEVNLSNRTGNDSS